MANIEDVVNQAIADFDEIETAIEDMGVDVPDGTDTKEYGNLIRSISGGADQSYNPTSQKAQSGIAVAEALKTLPIKYVVSPDENDNTIYLRDLESGTYVLQGAFKPYEESGTVCRFSSNLLVNVVKGTLNKVPTSHIQIFYPVHNVVQFVDVTDSSYKRTDIKLNELASTTSVEEMIAVANKASQELYANALIELSASGDNITITDSAEARLRGLKLYGKSEQNGTPTPDNPIEIESVGELVTDESDINYGKYRVPIVCRGKNFFSMKKVRLPQQTINGITFTPLDDERIHITGKMVEANYTTYVVEYAGSPIPLKAGQYRGKAFSNWDFNYGVYSGGSFLTNISKNNGNVSKDGYLTNIYIGIPASVTQELDVIIELQVEKGTSVTPYEPYVEPITTNLFLNEPLRKLGNYADYIDFKNKKLHRLLHEYYIDGSQTVQKHSSNYCFILTNVNCKQGAYNPCSSHFMHEQYNNAIPCIAMVNATGTRILIGNYSQIEGVTDEITLKQWLSENPVTFIQPLETPIEEPLSEDAIEEYNKLCTRYNSTNIITSDGRAYIEVEYVADTKKYIDNKIAEMKEELTAAIITE